METETIQPQNPYLVPLAIVVAGILIAGAIYMGDSKSQNPPARGNEAETGPVEVTPVSERDHVLGSRSAEVIVIEYSDTECPFCKSFHNTMKSVVGDYNGKVAWVYRHFPIAQLHALATKEAEATECAYELGGNQGFWNYIDKVFETTNSNDSLDPSELPKIAAAVGLDANAFNTCLSSGRYAEYISKSIEEAVKSGARGTPYSIAISKNGDQIIINGAEPVATVKAKINSLLK